MRAAGWGLLSGRGQWDGGRGEGCCGWEERDYGGGSLLFRGRGGASSLAIRPYCSTVFFCCCFVQFFTQFFSSYVEIFIQNIDSRMQGW